VSKGNSPAQLIWKVTAGPLPTPIAFAKEQRSLDCGRDKN
jgi:hypothetical protein